MTKSNNKKIITNVGIDKKNIRTKNSTINNEFERNIA